MKFLLTVALLAICWLSVVLAQPNNNLNSPQEQPGGQHNASNNGTNGFDKNKATRIVISNTFGRLTSDLLYLRDFIMAVIGEVSRTCGCDASVLQPFLPPGGQPGQTPPGPSPGAAPDNFQPRTTPPKTA